ncbi:MAG: hypothetical protein LBQ83_07965 [Candidatus Margulisbacteria bacterium]|jgi:hypothetical protein|nr:hypothetical protein [Candidatus Margulisiibacteriota bacterium]
MQKLFHVEQRGRGQAPRQGVSRGTLNNMALSGIAGKDGKIDCADAPMRYFKRLNGCADISAVLDVLPVPFFLYSQLVPLNKGDGRWLVSGDEPQRQGVSRPWLPFACPFL